MPPLPRRRARRRARRADAGQVHVHRVPVHLDDPEALKWGMSAEQLLQALSGLCLVALVAALAVFVLPGPLLGWRLLGPLLVAAPLAQVAIWLARWRPDEQLPLAFVLGYLGYRWAPKHADWLPKEYLDAFAVQPQPTGDDDLEDD